MQWGTGKGLRLASFHVCTLSVTSLPLPSPIHFRSECACAAGLVWPWLILKLTIYSTWGQMESGPVSMTPGLLDSGFLSAGSLPTPSEFVFSPVTSNAASMWSLLG